MGWASAYIVSLQNGEAVQFRPRGNSMTGKIESGQLCTVEPVEPATVKVGDIVLCKVTGVDLQVPAIMTYLERHGLRLLGTEFVDIGSWKGQTSHAISIRLSPLHIKVTGDPKMTLEQFWQEKKCLAGWEDDEST